MEKEECAAICFFILMHPFCIFCRMLKIITIEGNIGSGKTTLLKLFEKETTMSGIVVNHEPVAEFKRLWNNSNVNPLQEFYSNPERNSFALQNYILDVYSDRLANIFTDVSHQICVMDRGIDACQIFTDVNSKCFTHFEKEYLHAKCDKIRRKYFKSELGSDALFYLDVEPSASKDRIIVRDRPEERNVGLPYLNIVRDLCDRYYVTAENKIPSYRCVNSMATSTHAIRCLSTFVENVMNTF